MNTLDQVIEEQDKFIKREQLVSALLKMHQERQQNPKLPGGFNRKDDLFLFIEGKLRKRYELEKFKDNPEYFWECLEDFASDVETGIEGNKKRYYIGLRSNGIFEVFAIVPKNKRISMDDAIKFTTDWIGSDI